MYVQSTEARQESHCCEQFERRADLPDEEVDVLFLQRKELKHSFMFCHFMLRQIYQLAPFLFMCAHAITLQYKIEYLFDFATIF